MVTGLYLQRRNSLVGNKMSNAISNDDGRRTLSPANSLWQPKAGVNRRHGVFHRSALNGRHEEHTY